MLVQCFKSCEVYDGYQLTAMFRFQEEEKNDAELLATCSEQLYPDIPTPSLPASVPLASHAGHYHHPAYDSIFVSLDCKEEKSDSTLTSQVGTQDEGCQLLLARDPNSQLQFHGNLTHKTGDFWLSYIFHESLDVAMACLRTQFRVDASGTVASIGIDVRLEEEDTPLVWFDRVK